MSGLTEMRRQVLSQYCDLAVRPMDAQEGEDTLPWASWGLPRSSSQDPVAAEKAAHGLELHAAAEKGKADVVKMYLDFNTDPNVRDYMGRTPLHVAAAMGRYEVVKVLHEQKLTDINAKDIYGRTALQIAETPIESADETPPDATAVRVNEGRDEIVKQ